MNSLTWVTLPVFIALSMTSPAVAQESSPPSPASPPQASQAAAAPSAHGRSLTLPQALDLAARQNLDLVAARAQRAVSQAGVRIAGQRPNPSVNFAATRDEPHESLFFDQSVEIGSKRRRRIELAQQEIALTDMQIAAFERQLRRNTRDAFFALALARGATAQRSGILKLAVRLDEIAKARFSAGDIPQLEVTQAELEVSRARADFQVAQQQEKVALTELNALLNEPPSIDWDLGEALSSLPPAMTLSDMLSRAAASNSEIARISQELKVEQSRKALYQAQRIPNLGLQAGMDFNSPHDFEVGARGQISMEMPIFSRYQGEIAQSTAAASALESELAAVSRSVEAHVESAFYDLDARRAQVRLYRDTLLPSSRRLEEMAEESYQAGKANILTVLGAQRDVQQVERDYLDSLLAMQTSFSLLEEAVGTPLD